MQQRTLISVPAQAWRSEWGLRYDAPMQADKGHLKTWISQVLALLLLGGAIFFALKQVDLFALREASLINLAGLGAAVIANVVLTGLLFWVITRSFEAKPGVRLGPMVMLIAWSGLLNYVPLVRPGLWGRAAYLKNHHQLPIRQSLMILAVVLGLTLVVLGSVSVAMLLLPDPIRIPVILVGGAMLTWGTKPIAQMLLAQPMVLAWAWVPLRLADLLVTVGRLMLAFDVMGHPIDSTTALVAASASLLIKLVGLTPNGLGLSAWVVGLVASAMGDVTPAMGVAAGLIDRAVEVLVMIPLGLLSAWRLSGKSR